MKRQSATVFFPYIIKKGREKNEAFIKFLRFATYVSDNIFYDSCFAKPNVM